VPDDLIGFHAQQALEFRYDDILDERLDRAAACKAVTDCRLARSNSAVVCAATRLDGRHHDHVGLLVEADDGPPVTNA
jgi:hypothetical protein